LRPVKEDPVAAMPVPSRLHRRPVKEDPAAAMPLPSRLHRSHDPSAWNPLLCQAATRPPRLRRLGRSRHTRGRSRSRTALCPPPSLLPLPPTRRPCHANSTPPTFDCQRDAAVWGPPAAPARPPSMPSPPCIHACMHHRPLCAPCMSPRRAGPHVCPRARAGPSRIGGPPPPATCRPSAPSAARGLCKALETNAGGARCPLRDCCLSPGTRCVPPHWASPWGAGGSECTVCSAKGVACRGSSRACALGDKAWGPGEPVGAKRVKGWGWRAWAARGVGKGAGAHAASGGGGGGEKAAHARGEETTRRRRGPEEGGGRASGRGPAGAGGAGRAAAALLLQRARAPRPARRARGRAGWRRDHSGSPFGAG
jgi:hypothetical protein